MSSRHVPARELPVPATVSPVMQRIIGVDPPSSATSLTVPRTTEQWLELIAQRRERAVESLPRLRERFNVVTEERWLAGVRCYVVSPACIAARNQHRVLINLHSGGHVFGGGEGGTLEAVYMAALAGLRVTSVDYRMPPEFPFPAAMDDAMAVWRELLSGTSARHLALFGFSSGGGMALAMTQRAKLEGVALPAALMVGTPWSDLSKTGDSYFTNAGVDNGLVTYEGLLEAAARLYANGRDLTDPRLSPVYGDFSGFPPTLLTTGTRDLFLSNTVRVHRKLRDAGVETQLDVYEGQSHGPQYLDPDAPETTALFGQAAKFFDAHLGPGPYR
jgi:acetyl esterase/lipase